jgi:signal transduction histidine kinase/ligand-binding sensor domain-containing protein
MFVGVRPSLLLLSLGMLVPAVAHAQTPSFGFKLWTADTGLPQNIIRGLHQTDDGYLWVATLDGVARFDGVQFTVFDRASSPGIASSRFTSILGHGGDLWLGTDGGGMTRYHDGRFRAYTSGDGVPPGVVRTAWGDEAGHVRGMSSDAILEWDARSDRFIDVTPTSPRIHYEWTMWEGGGFWGVNGRQVRCLLQGRAIDYALPAGIDARQIFGVARDGDGTLWMETIAGIVYRFPADPGSGPATVVSPGARIVYRDRSGQAWSFILERHLLRRLTNDASRGTGGILFSMLLEDREGNLWLGTEGQGLYQVRSQFIATYSREQGVGDRNIYTIAQDRAGSIWIGGWNGTLTRWRDGEITTYSATDGLSTWGITALAEDHAGRLWIASSQDLRILEDGRARQPDRPPIPERSTIQAMLATRDGAFWIGTTRGLLRWTGGTPRLYTAADGLAADDVRVLVEDREGAMWIGGYGGVTRMRDGRFDRWTARDGLPGDTTRAIYPDADGVVWIGSYDGGLVRLHEGRLTGYTTRTGLPANGAFQILEDARGQFWISSNRGIYRVSKRELHEYAAGRRRSVTAVAYGSVDGMRNVECNGGYWPAGVKARDGRLWFPTQDGAAVIDIASVPANTQAPPVIIESVRLDQRAVPLDDEILVPPDRENLEVQYTALSFVNSDQARFRYQLEGLDSGWTDAGRRRVAYYSHLPPGSYRFRVIAGNSDGVWNEQGRHVRITVLAPFYHRPWFLALSGFAGMATLAGAWRYHVLQFQRREAAQQTFSRQLISAQEHERKRIAADLHDSLGQRLIVVKNLAMLYLQHQRSRHAGDETRLSAIEEISAEAALALKETRKISYNLRPSQLDRLGLTKAIHALVRRVSGASGVAMTSSLDRVDDLFPCDLHINIYRIVQESLSNIVRHADASSAEVTMRRSGSHVILTVQDDGRGLAARASGDEPALDGFGLTGMNERARLVDGRLDVQSLQGQGTRITVTFDLDRSLHERH